MTGQPGGYAAHLYERRTEATDPHQRDHLARCPWMKPGDCTCRRSPDGGYYNVCIVASCTRPGKACGGYCSVCFTLHYENVRFLSAVPKLDYHYLAHQREWSDTTFGPGARTKGVIDHIAKELIEVEASDGDLSEWADVIILGLDGATRSAIANGGSVADVLYAVAEKQAHNEARVWPDWRTCDPDKAIEHVEHINGTEQS